MSIQAALAAMGGGAEGPLYSDDVFSAYTYTGNGSTQSIVNGIDLAGKGGMVWTKGRDLTVSHGLVDSVRGVANKLYSDGSWAQDSSSISSFNSNGYSLSNGGSVFNTNNNTYVSWTFRKAAKFFDVVQFNGNGSTNHRISHSLGVAPGLIIMKKTGAVDAWYVYHSSLGRSKYLLLNTTDAAVTQTNAWGTSDPTSTDFGVDDSSFNGYSTGVIAYLFAHDDSATGIIQCGSVSTGAGGAAEVNLGWEAQFCIMRYKTATHDWSIHDTSRKSSLTSYGLLYADVANAENSGTGSTYVYPTATGFGFANYAGGETMLYIAIRRPNKPPTSGTQVYNAIARTGTGAAATVTGVGFAPDLLLGSDRAATGVHLSFTDRLRGSGVFLYGTGTAAEITTADEVTAFGMDGVSLGTSGTYASLNYNTRTYINWFFRRAPGVFDEVCWLCGTNTNRSLNHNLGVAPEFLFFKQRTSAGTNWWAYHSALGLSAYLALNTTDASTSHANSWGTTGMTATTFSLDENYLGANNKAHVAYLFATLAGISKVGSYTGNGSSQTINCGFAAGARFIMIKRTNASGDWFIYDTVRGINAGNDPHLSLNTTAAEVNTTDDIDAANSGFIVNQNATTNLNVNTATYIFLAFA